MDYQWPASPLQGVCNNQLNRDVFYDVSLSVFNACGWHPGVVVGSWQPLPFAFRHSTTNSHVSSERRWMKVMHPIPFGWSQRAERDISSPQFIMHV